MIDKDELIALRKNHSASQRDMAFKFGVSVRTYQRMESGEKNIGTDEFHKVQNGFELGYKALNALEIMISHDRLFVADILFGYSRHESVIMGMDCDGDGGACVTVYNPMTVSDQIGMWGVSHVFKEQVLELPINDFLHKYAEREAELQGFSKFSATLCR